MAYTEQAFRTKHCRKAHPVKSVLHQVGMAEQHVHSLPEPVGIPSFRSNHIMTNTSPIQARYIRHTAQEAGVQVAGTVDQPQPPSACQHEFLHGAINMNPAAWPLEEGRETHAGVEGNTGSPRGTSTTSEGKPTYLRLNRHVH